MYYIYIIRCDDNSLYTGITKDITRRMYQHIHKLKEAASYTKSRNVVSLEALFIADDRSAASKLEYQIKKLPKHKKEALILNPSLLEAYQTTEIKNEYFNEILKQKSK